ncbi:MAG: hypothetical protein AB7N76_10215 [Planctomycetota bacterium]
MSRLLLLAAFLGLAGCQGTPQPSPQPHPAQARPAVAAPPGIVRVEVEVAPGEAQEEVRRRAAERALELVLADWYPPALPPARRAALAARCVDLLSRERTTGSSYSADLRRVEVEDRLLDELGTDRTFGADAFVVAPLPCEWFAGEGLTVEEQEGLPRLVHVALADHLHRLRFRETEAEAEQVRKAALELGASATTQRVHEFAAAFQAALAITIQGRIRFEPAPLDSEEAREHLGRLRCEAVTAELYDRNAEAVLARVVLRSSKEPAAGALGEPLLRRGASLSGACESYAREIGRALGREVVRRTFERLYANQR